MSNMNPLGDIPTSRTGAGLTSGGMGAAGATRTTSSSERDYAGSRSYESIDTTRHGAVGEGRIREKAAKVKEQAGQVAGQARAKSAQVREQVSEYTGNNPILSLALAFFAGVLLTAITRR